VLTMLNLIGMMALIPMKQLLLTFAKSMIPMKQVMLTFAESNYLRI